MGIKFQSHTKHGGSRKGSGAKKKYGEKTIVVSARCPKSKAIKLKSIIDKYLSRL